MSLCKGCGAPLEWIRTKEGRYMPVDPEPVFIIEGTGPDNFITDEGEVIRGRAATAEEKNNGLEVAFVPHWKTCPAAGSFRHKKKASDA